MVQRRSQIVRWLIVLVVWITGRYASAGPTGSIVSDTTQKTVMMTDGGGHLSIRLSYAGRCVLDRVVVRGRQVSADSGVSSGIDVGGVWYRTRDNIPTPQVTATRDVVNVTGIVFGPTGGAVHESWRFTVKADGIDWRITREYGASTTIDDTGLPEWDFADMSTWTGGMLGNGGVVWNKYLDQPNTTYGTHSGTVTFWSEQHNDCLRVTPSFPVGFSEAARFTHQPAGSGQQQPFSFNYVVSRAPLQPKHDFRRFLQDRQDLWAPFDTQTGTVTVDLALQALDYGESYDRGTFRGVDGAAVRALLNTVGRYGVIDTGLVGGNGWRTGNICLHEQWFAEIGLALDDSGYNADLAADLDFERDHAIAPNGRVIARWSYDAGDAMPGSFDANGFYEAQWGYLIDSQPDYVINVAEEYDLSGDQRWLAGQKPACEKALDYLIAREVDDTGLVTVLTDSYVQKRGSDWFDVIWASYENGLVNVELYEALILWARDEETLGDTAHAMHYRAFANRLKVSFNRPIADGGFWDPANNGYVYWREKDGSAHGDNLFLPINFAAIAYGLCDDPARRGAILDGIEAQMQKEHLFAWPVNVTSFAPGEAMRRNYPFPNYENGAIFLSWAELGVRAYASYAPQIALDYVKKLLDRYQKDGLSFQRYERDTQQGAGDDFLSGNCMAIVGLYRDLYGIQPKPNRLLLDPHLTAELNGTRLNYGLRGRHYAVWLSTTGCAIAEGGASLHAPMPFGIDATETQFTYFAGRRSEPALAVGRAAGQSVTVAIEVWTDELDGPRRWTESGTTRGRRAHLAAGLRPGRVYQVRVNGHVLASARADRAGHVAFALPTVPDRSQYCELLLVSE